jgi:hypothetical protein
MIKVRGEREREREREREITLSSTRKLENILAVWRRGFCSKMTAG